LVAKLRAAPMSSRRAGSAGGARHPPDVAALGKHQLRLTSRVEITARVGLPGLCYTARMSDQTDFAKAYQAIGEYFCAFSELDRELGEAVKVVLGLTKHPAGDFVVAALQDPARKARLVQAAVAVAKNADGSETSAKWKKSAEKTVKKALGHNKDTRVPLAHSYLEPQADGLVRVTRLNLRDGQLTGEPKPWKFEHKIKQAREITKKLQKITIDLSELKISIPELDWLVPLSEPALLTLRH
jgi:hypothetical protein